MIFVEQWDVQEKNAIKHMVVTKMSYGSGSKKQRTTGPELMGNDESQGKKAGRQPESVLGGRKRSRGQK